MMTLFFITFAVFNVLIFDSLVLEVEKYPVKFCQLSRNPDLTRRDLNSKPTSLGLNSGFIILISKFSIVEE